MIAVRTIARKLRECQRGASAVEYGLIAALIIVAMTAGLSTLGGGSGAMWGMLKNKAETHMS